MASCPGSAVTYVKPPHHGAALQMRRSNACCDIQWFHIDTVTIFEAGLSTGDAMLV